MKYINRKKKEWFQRLILLMLITGFGLILNSCYPGSALTPADTDVVATFYKPGTDFSTKMTYAIPDSVARIDRDGNSTGGTGQYDQQILDRIKQNLDQIGFTEEQNPANADVLVVAFITTTTWVSGGCYTWWYSWWYPYPGYCYPVVYTYNSGSLLIAMGDSQNQGKTDALWVAGINGILDDTSSGISTRLNNNINQAFTQSPYLGEGK